MKPCGCVRWNFKTKVKETSMKNRILFAALGALLMAGTASAGELPGRYTYAGAGYAKADVKNSSIDADGFGVSAGYGFANGLYAGAQADRLGVDGASVDVDRYGLTLGGHRNIGKADAFVEVGAERNRALGVNADGYRLGAGARYAFTDRAEGLLQVNYRDGDSYSGSTSGVVGGRYLLTGNWSADASAEIDSDGRIYRAGVRYAF